MNRLIFSCLLSCFFWTISLTSSIAKSIEPENKVDIIGTNTVECDEYFSEVLNDISVKKTQNTNGVLASLDGLMGDNIPLKNKFSEIKVEPSSGSYLGACEDDEYYVQISGARFGDGWDISSVTICGVEVCHILMQSSNIVIVYPNAGTPGVGDIVITSKSLGKTTIQNAFTYKATVPNEQFKNAENSIIK
jgi:hypothetical protein